MAVKHIKRRRKRFKSLLMFIVKSGARSGKPHEKRLGSVSKVHRPSRCSRCSEYYHNRIRCKKSTLSMANKRRKRKAKNVTSLEVLGNDVDNDEHNYSLGSQGGDDFREDREKADSWKEDEKIRNIKS
ncbi:Uncharacterized protein Fot_23403 [Forsythia ovata]|uniref:Uncharacterized protein n=1 Tax=Forsythia ovata TaxID=205694 RepID=A0ABD1V0G1_9LAMI